MLVLGFPMNLKSSVQVSDYLSLWDMLQNVFVVHPKITHYHVVKFIIQIIKIINTINNKTSL